MAFPGNMLSTVRDETRLTQVRLLQSYTLPWEDAFPDVMELGGKLGAYLEFPSLEERFLIQGWSLQVSPYTPDELRSWLGMLEEQRVEEGEEGSRVRMFGMFAFSRASRHRARFGLPRLLWHERGGERWVTLYHVVMEGERPLSLAALQEQLDQELWEGGFRVANANAGGREAGGMGETGKGKPPLTEMDKSLAEEGDGADRSAQHKDAGALFGAAPETFVRDHSFIPLPDLAEWTRQIALLQEAMRRGEVRKVVLARTLHLQSEFPWNAEKTVRNLRKRYQQANLFLFRFAADESFLGATPERLARVEAGNLETVALAGSLPRGKDAEEDALLQQRLLTDARLRKEHGIVVEHILTQLKPLTESLAVSERRPLLLPNVQHLQVQIRGSLRKGYDVLDVVQALHPTAALGGEPRQAALEWLERLEPFDRGWYGAPFGWVDAQGDGDFYVALRCGLLQGTQAILYAGAGILPESDPLAEWEETGLKFQPMLQAMEEVGGC